MASNHGAVAAALLLGAGLAMAPGVGPGVAAAGSAADGQMSRRRVDSFAPASGFLRVEAAAGFQKMVADSPAKVAHLETLTLVAMQEHLDYDTGTWDPWAPWP